VTDSEASSSEDGPSSSPLERARAAAAEEPLDADALAGALADAEAELASLRDALAAAEARAATLDGGMATARDQLLRLTADFDNYRRRTAAEKDALADSVRGDVVQQMLPLIDNFEMARTQVKAESEAEQKINAAYQGLYRQMVDMMRALGVEAVPTTGSPFDPALHEAIMREASAEVPDGTVLQEFRKGFRLGDKLLRPAMVKVSFDDSTPPAAASAAGDGEAAASSEE
jgi:molecular chaperone GrpE